MENVAVSSGFHAHLLPPVKKNDVVYCDLNIFPVGEPKLKAVTLHAKYGYGVLMSL